MVTANNMKVRENLSPNQKDAILAKHVTTDVTMAQMVKDLHFVELEVRHGSVPHEVFADNLVVFPVKTNKKGKADFSSLEVHDPNGVYGLGTMDNYRITAGGYWTSDSQDTAELFTERLNKARQDAPKSPRQNRTQQTIDALMDELKAHNIEVPADILERYAKSQESGDGEESGDE